MDRDDIRLLEQLVPRDECGAHFSRALGREILAPGDHLHAEGVADLCPAPPTLPRPRTPSVCPAMSSPTDCCHPPPRSDVFSATRLRALPRMSAQVSSIVGVEV